MIYQMIYKTRNSKRCYRSYVDTKELEEAIKIWRGYGFKKDVTLIGVNIVNKKLYDDYRHSIVSIDYKKNVRRINYLADKCAHDYKTWNGKTPIYQVVYNSEVYAFIKAKNVEEAISKINTYDIAVGIRIIDNRENYIAMKIRNDIESWMEVKC